MIALQDIRSLTDFQRNTKSHLRRLKRSGRLEVLTVNGNAELIVQSAAAYEEMVDAIRGIQRGLDEMKAGKGEPARKVLDRIRAKHKISRTPRGSIIRSSYCRRRSVTSARLTNGWPSRMPEPPSAGIIVCWKLFCRWRFSRNAVH